MIYFVGPWYNYSSLWWKSCELTTMKLGTMIGKYFSRYKVRMVTFMPGYVWGKFGTRPGKNIKPVPWTLPFILRLCVFSSLQRQQSWLWELMLVQSTCPGCEEQSKMLKWERKPWFGTRIQSSKQLTGQTPNASDSHRQSSRAADGGRAAAIHLFLLLYPFPTGSHCSCTNKDFTTK